MKPRVAHRPTAALTLVEVFVVIVVLAFLAALVLSVDRPDKWKVDRVNCMNNLKEISLAYRIWQGDHNDKYPMEISVTNGGTMELAFAGDVSATFRVITKDLNMATNFLVCPADFKKIQSLKNSSRFSAANISYFVALDASGYSPTNFLSGDDSIEINGQPVKSGLLELATDSRASWNTNRHRCYGNVALTDGSVTDSTPLGGHFPFGTLTNLLHQTGLATNRLAIP